MQFQSCICAWLVWIAALFCFYQTALNDQTLKSPLLLRAISIEWPWMYITCLKIVFCKFNRVNLVHLINTFLGVKTNTSKPLTHTFTYFSLPSNTVQCINYCRAVFFLVWSSKPFLALASLRNCLGSMTYICRTNRICPLYSRAWNKLVSWEIWKIK